MNYEVDFIGPNRWAPSHRRYVRGMLGVVFPEALGFVSNLTGKQVTEFKMNVVLEGVSEHLVDYVGQFRADEDDMCMALPFDRTVLKHRKINIDSITSDVVHESMHYIRYAENGFEQSLGEEIIDEGIAYGADARFQSLYDPSLLRVIETNADDASLPSRIRSVVTRLARTGLNGDQMYEEVFDKHHDIGLGEDAQIGIVLGSWIVENQLRRGATFGQLIMLHKDELFDWQTFELKELQ